MRSTNNLFGILLVLLSCTSATKVGAQLLWKATSSNNSPPLYLFGTMHMAADKFLEQNAYIRAAIDSSDVVFTEVALDDAEIASQMLRYIFLPEGMRLSDSLNAMEWALLDSILLSFNNPMMSATSLVYCKPLYVQFAISGMQFQTVDTNSGSDAVQKSVDYSVVKYAESAHKNLRYFETPGQQLQYLFNDPPLDMQFRLLKNALRNHGLVDSMETLVSKLPEYYFRQSIDTIGQLMEYMFLAGNDSKKLSELLLRDRNYRWLASIKHFVSIGRNSAFIAVGAGHLVGENGLLELLRKEGYLVEPVYSK